MPMITALFNNEDGRLTRFIKKLPLCALPSFPSFQIISMPATTCLSLLLSAIPPRAERRSVATHPSSTYTVRTSQPPHAA